MSMFGFSAAFSLGTEKCGEVGLFERGVRPRVGWGYGERPPDGVSSVVLGDIWAGTLMLRWCFLAYVELKITILI